ncbi:MAG: hypothetical protein ACXU9A_09570 [Xanthobacteraceae bacterium]
MVQDIRRKITGTMASRCYGGKMPKCVDALFDVRAPVGPAKPARNFAPDFVQLLRQRFD